MIYLVHCFIMHNFPLFRYICPLSPVFVTNNEVNLLLQWTVLYSHGNLLWQGSFLLWGLWGSELERARSPHNEMMRTQLYARLLPCSVRGRAARPRSGRVVVCRGPYAACTIHHPPSTIPSHAVRPRNWHQLLHISANLKNQNAPKIPVETQSPSLGGSLLGCGVTGRRDAACVAARRRVKPRCWVWCGAAECGGFVPVLEAGCG